MPQIRKWSARVEHQLGVTTITFECPYFYELVEGNSPEGRLPRTEFAAHALWEYYGMALIQYNRAKANIVLEDDLSLKFDRDIARQMFLSTAKKHGVRPDEMVRFWAPIHMQRIALGGKDQLPDEFMFRFWGH